MRIRKAEMISRLGLLTALTIVIQIAGLPQPVTGPLINGIIILTVLWIGPLPAIALGCLTPLAALIRGQLPPVLMPMLPFIMLGNTVYALTFFILSLIIAGKKTTLLKSLPGLTVASALKTLLLYLGATWMIPLIFVREIPRAAVVMMSFPQFLTAVAGGLIALLLWRYMLSNLSQV